MGSWNNSEGWWGVAVPHSGLSRLCAGPHDRDGRPPYPGDVHGRGEPAGGPLWAPPVSDVRAAHTVDLRPHAHAGSCGEGLPLQDGG